MNGLMTTQQIRDAAIHAGLDSARKLAAATGVSSFVCQKVLKAPVAEQVCHESTLLRFTRFFYPGRFPDAPESEATPASTSPAEVA